MLPPQCGRLSTKTSLLILCLWASFTVTHATAAAGRPGSVYTLDLRPLNRMDLRASTNAAKLWDTLHTAAALQGLVNRNKPQLYLFYCSDFGVDTDAFWLDWLRQEDGWLKDAVVHPLGSLEEAIRVFRKHFDGLVVYDTNVPATSNLASTAAGCEDLLPVRLDSAADSMFDLLCVRMQLPVRLWLVKPDGRPRFEGRGNIPDSSELSSGSAKIDAYRWAIDRYLKSGRCAPRIAAYYLDAFWLQHPTQAGPTMHTLSNHDYFISKRAFFFDLSPWGDETPSDDPQQAPGQDRQQFLDTLRALYHRSRGEIIQVGGFTPWPYKYTSHAKPPGKHDGVPSEWEFGRLISQYNGFMEADAAGLGGMANASFYRHYPLAKRYRQPNGTPGISTWKAMGHLDDAGKVAPHFYVGHYVGDYDAPSWLYKAVPKFFRDPARGKVPLGWAFDPNLADRAPQALVYAYRYATSNDFFIAGDSGAGYLNPRALTIRPDSVLPPGLNKWVEHCQKHYQRWDMSITGFILDGSGGASTPTEFGAYRSFSPNGAGTHFEPGPGMRAGIPTCREHDLPDDAGAAAESIAQAARQKRDGPGFFWARSILRPPAWYAELSETLDRKHAELQIRVVDPYTFFGLIGLHYSQGE
jgi:hypothetical protein